MMREMKFFFHSTDYKTVMGGMMRRNSDSDEEDPIDHAEVSKRAKKAALKRYNGNIPDYVYRDSS